MSGCRKRTPSADLEEPCRRGRVRRHGGEPEPVGRTPQQRRVADGVGCRHEQQAPALLRERLELPREAELDAIRQRHRAGRPETARELPGSQAAGQLEQRQGVAAGLADDAVAQPHVERPVDRRGQQPARVRVTQPTDVEARKSREVQPVARLAHREDHAHRLREQAAGDEGEGLRRGAVLPLGVVDHAEQRALLCDLGEEAQHGQADEEAIRRVVADGPAECRAERVALRTGQSVEAVEHRRTELMQSGVRQLHLGLDAGRPCDTTAGRPRDEVVQQRGLAGAGLAAQDQDVAAARAHARDDAVERRAFVPPAQQARRPRRPDRHAADPSQACTPPSTGAAAGGPRTGSGTVRPVSVRENSAVDRTAPVL